MSERIVCRCRKCRKEVEVFGSSFCSDCYYPGICEDYRRFDALCEEGYTRYQARIMLVWLIPMTTDPLGRAAHRAIDAYCWASKPSAQLEHAVLDSVMRLIAERSKLALRVQFVDVVFSRGFDK